MKKGRLYDTKTREKEINEDSIQQAVHCIAELGSVSVCAIFDGGNSKPKINCNEGAKGTFPGPPVSLTDSQ